MFHTIQNKFNHLSDDCTLYPGHGAGSLCGKNLKADNSSTLGSERLTNWAFQQKDEQLFVNELLDSQPMIPHYFSYAVDINAHGATSIQRTTADVKRFLKVSEMEEATLIIDTRDEKAFKAGHLEDSINIMATSEGSKFETWLGSIVRPDEDYFIVAESVADFDKLLERVARIGYENRLKAIMTVADSLPNELEAIDLSYFKKSAEDHYTILDVRNDGELENGKIFDTALHIPLHQLRERVEELPTDKPVVVHCAAGYRSAAAASILNKKLPETGIYDLSNHIQEFK